MEGKERRREEKGDGVQKGRDRGKEEDQERRKEGKKRQEVGWARGRALNINPVSTSINNKVVCVCTVKQICISLYS